MNNNQIKTVLNALIEFKSSNIDEILSSVFLNQDIATVKIGQYSVSEYTALVKRLFKQFESEINENGLFLPFQYNFANEFGSGNLQSDISNTLANIKSKNINNLNNSLSFISRLVYYQIVNGFWDKSTRKIHKHSEIEINKLNNELQYITQQANENFKSLRQAIGELEHKKDELQKFIQQKNAELQQITNNLQSSNNNNNQIASILNQSTAYSSKIEAILTQQQQNLEKSRKDIEQQHQSLNTQKDSFLKLEEIFKTKFLEIEQSQNKRIQALDGQIEEFNKSLDFVEGKKSFFEERNTYLENLIGREVGASLFETFKQRKEELDKPVERWNIIVIGASILTFIAVLGIFTNGFGLWGDSIPSFSWQQVIINSLKSSPFFFLLFYSISQYNKERNFQEEYAFKSAVALTIKAYADIIQREELKDEMITNSVTSIYKSPITQKTKLSKDENTILETAKELITTALDTYKKK